MLSMHANHGTLQSVDSRGTLCGHGGRRKGQRPRHRMAYIWRIFWQKKSRSRFHAAQPRFVCATFRSSQAISLDSSSDDHESDEGGLESAADAVRTLPARAASRSGASTVSAAHPFLLLPSTCTSQRRQEGNTILSYIDMMTMDLSLSPNMARKSRPLRDSEGGSLVALALKSRRICA